MPQISPVATPSSTISHSAASTSALNIEELSKKMQDLAQFLQGESSEKTKACAVLSNTLRWDTKLWAILKATCIDDNSLIMADNFDPTRHLSNQPPLQANLQTLLAKTEEVAWQCSNYYQSTQSEGSLDDPSIPSDQMKKALDFLAETRVTLNQKLRSNDREPIRPFLKECTLTSKDAEGCLPGNFCDYVMEKVKFCDVRFEKNKDQWKNARLIDCEWSGKDEIHSLEGLAEATEIKHPNFTSTGYLTKLIPKPQKNALDSDSQCEIIAHLQKDNERDETVKKLEEALKAAVAAKHQAWEALKAIPSRSPSPSTSGDAQSPRKKPRMSQDRPDFA
jgi:hypothetical protein